MLLKNIIPSYTSELGKVGYVFTLFMYHLLELDLSFNTC